MGSIKTSFVQSTSILGAERNTDKFRNSLPRRENAKRTGIDCSDLARTAEGLRGPASLLPALDEPGYHSQVGEFALRRAHLHHRESIRSKFGTADHQVPPEKRYIVHTVTESEGLFLAGYLGVPAQNVFKIKTHDIRSFNRSADKDATRLADEVHGFLKRAALTGEAPFEHGSLTFLGHMVVQVKCGKFSSFDGCSEPTLERRFAKLDVHHLFNLFSVARPDHLNFLSCNSQSYSGHFAQLFSQAGFDVPHCAFVYDGVEVSQYPKRHNIALLYAGPEIGGTVTGFDTRHFPADKAIGTRSSISAPSTGSKVSLT